MFMYGSRAEDKSIENAAKARQELGGEVVLNRLRCHILQDVLKNFHFKQLDLDKCSDGSMEV